MTGWIYESTHAHLARVPTGKKTNPPFLIPNLLLRFGGYSAGDPPDPIPNSEVKPRWADGTAGLPWWESTSPPIYLSGTTLFSSSRAEQGLSALMAPTGERAVAGARACAGTRRSSGEVTSPDGPGFTLSRE